MLDTVKIQDKGKVKMVAHRGLSGIETENTNPAFVAAANRSFFGIETDVHKTVDGKLVLMHDGHTGRVAENGTDLVISEESFETLRALPLKGGRIDYRIPTLDEYLSVCKRYGKTAVLEIKGTPGRETVKDICAAVEAAEMLENTVFISFSFESCVQVRERYKDHPIQFLCDDVDDDLIEKLIEYNFGLDVYFEYLTEEKVRKCKEKGIEVNCWTVNDLPTAKKLISWGVDYITTNILE